MTLEIGGVQFQVLVMYKYRLPLKLNVGRYQSGKVQKPLLFTSPVLIMLQAVRVI